MSLSGLAALIILVGAMAAFTLNRWRADLIAFAVLLALGLTGLVSVEQAVSGFGTPAVIAVASIFVVGAGLERTGLAARVSATLRRLAGRSRRRLIVVLMLASGFLAGIMLNLAAIGVLLPAVVTIAHRRRISPTLLLMPVAYAALFGGKLTLIAGPSNLIVADIVARRDIASLGFFDFIPIGLPMLLVGTAWMATVGWRFLPPRPPEELLRAVRRRARLVKLYRLSERLFEARIPAASRLVGRTIEQSEFGRAYGLSIVSVVRDGRHIIAPPKTLTLEQGDRLVVEGRLDEMLEAEAFERVGLELAAQNVSLDSPNVAIVEAVISPRSWLAGQTLRDAGFRDRYGLTVLALWREGRPVRTRLAEIPLRVGDGLLLQGPPRALKALRGDPDFIVLQEDLPESARRGQELFAALGVGVMIALALAHVHFAFAAAVAAAIMIVAGAVTMEEAYRAIDWRSIVVIGGMLPMGTALEQSGAAAFLIEKLVALVGGVPMASLAAILLSSAVVAHFIPPLAATVLMAPLALNIAAALEVSALPFVMAIIGAMGLTLLTPFSNPVMLIVMAPGGYTLRDYVRSGLPLALLLAAVLLLVIPLAFPF